MKHFMKNVHLSPLFLNYLFLVSDNELAKKDLLAAFTGELFCQQHYSYHKNLKYCYYFNWSIC